MGEVSELLQTYLERQEDLNVRRIAKTIHPPATPASVYWLLAGERSPEPGKKARPFLGLRRRGKAPALLIAVAQLLEIPESKLARALLTDLGYKRPARVSVKARVGRGKR